MTPACSSRRAWLGAAFLASTAAAGWVGWSRLRVPAGGTSGDAVEPPEVCIVAPPTPRAAFAGLPLDAPRPVPVDARCPVCGMFPARYPAWAAQAIYRDGDTHFFDSPVSLMLYLRDVPRHAPGRTAQDVAAVYVTDHARAAASSGGMPAWLDAREAWYVDGSDAKGPMRNGNLPAFATAQAAAAFALQRGGRVLAFDDLRGPVLDALDGRHRHSR